MVFSLGNFPVLENKDESLADDLLGEKRKRKRKIDCYEILEQNWREMKMIYCVLSEDKIPKEVKYCVYCRREQNSEEKRGGEKQNSRTKKRCLCQWQIWLWKANYSVTRIYPLGAKKSQKCVSGTLKDSGGSRTGWPNYSQCPFPGRTDRGELCQNTAEVPRKEAGLIREI